MHIMASKVLLELLLKPGSCHANLCTAELMPSILPVQLDIRASLAQECIQILALLRSAHRIAPASSDEDRNASQIRQGLIPQRNHRMVEYSSLQRISFVKQQARGDIGPVRITNRYDTAAVKTVLGCCPV